MKTEDKKVEIEGMIIGGTLYRCKVCGMEEMEWDFAKDGRVEVKLCTCQTCEERGE